MTHHEQPNKHIPALGMTDSQILAVVYTKLFEMDERLLDPESGKIPVLERRVDRYDAIRNRCIGAMKVFGGIGALTGVAAAAIEILKSTHH